MPVVYLADCPGLLIGLEAERAATIRHGEREMAPIKQASVPSCPSVVRKPSRVCGAGYIPAGRFAMPSSWLSAWWGSLPLEAGIEAAYRAEIGAAPDPSAKSAEFGARLNFFFFTQKTAYEMPK